MKRTAVNPWPMSLAFGYNQAEILEAPPSEPDLCGPDLRRLRRQLITS